MPKRLGKKALHAIIPVDKNKPKSERLFGTVYLEIVRSLSSNYLKMFMVWRNLWKSQYYLIATLGKCLYCLIWTPKRVFIVLFVSTGFHELWKICIVHNSQKISVLVYVLVIILWNITTGLCELWKVELWKIYWIW